MMDLRQLITMNLSTKLYLIKYKLNQVLRIIFLCVDVERERERERERDLSVSIHLPSLSLNQCRTSEILFEMERSPN